MKTILILILFLTLGCSDKRESPNETVKLFINYVEEKNIEKVYELLDEETKKKYSNEKEKLIRTNFQINKYKIKRIRLLKEDKNNNKYFMEVVLENDEIGLITLKKKDSLYYIYLE